MGNPKIRREDVCQARYEQSKCGERALYIRSEDAQSCANRKSTEGQSSTPFHIDKYELNDGEVRAGMCWTVIQGFKK